ncbi:hypothetical protein BX616_007207, partial [Lobosporangium transversale]
MPAIGPSFAIHLRTGFNRCSCRQRNSNCSALCLRSKLHYSAAAVAAQAKKCQKIKSLASSAGTEESDQQNKQQAIQDLTTVHHPLIFTIKLPTKAATEKSTSENEEEGQKPDFRPIPPKEQLFQVIEDD